MISLRHLILFSLSLGLVFPLGASELLVDLGYREEAGVISAEDRSSRNGRVILMNVADSHVAQHGEFSALSFPEGGSQYVEVKERVAFENGFSIAVWIHPANSKGWMEVVSCGLDSKPGGVRLRWGARGLVSVILGDASSVLKAPENSAPSGMWTHVAVVSDGLLARLFINGSEIASINSEGLAVAQPKSVPLIVGNYAGRKDAYPFRGEMGPVEIYDGALSSQEVQALLERSPSPSVPDNE